MYLFAIPGDGPVCELTQPELTLRKVASDSLSSPVEKPRAATHNGAAESAKVKRMITVEELEQHRALPSVWITINNKVYDVTRWIAHHPGGQAALLNVGGRDATDLMTQFHRPEVWKKRVTYWYIGDLVTDTDDSRKCSPSALITNEFRALGRWLDDNGWYNADRLYYVKKMAVLACLFAMAIYLFSRSIDGTQSPHWTLYLSGALIGLFWQQSNFVGHDVGHSSVFRDNSNHKYLGVIVGNMFTGLSISWWKHSHETHHVATNVISHDPDIQHLPVFAITDKMFAYINEKGAGIFSSYWNAYMPFDRASRFLVSYQHFLYFPIMSVARVNLLAQALMFTLTHEKCRGYRKVMELFTLALFYSWWGYMLYLCPTWSSRILFWYIANATVGIIHVQICLSHFIMETFDEVPYQKNTESYYEFQLRTTLDVDCPRHMDWFHGGLQYQTMHHLYPRVPRHRLRALRTKVEEIVARYPHVQYTHYPFIYANRLTIKHMKGIAQQARAGKLVPFKNTLIFEGLNAIG